MKTTAAAVLLLFFIFSTKSCSIGVASAANEPVLDNDGDELRAGVEYFVVSSIRGAGGGGLDLGWSPNQICPKFVVQHQLDLQSGKPLTFYPVNASDSVVHVSTDVRIVFVPALDAYCRSSTMWKLDNYDHSSGKWWVTTGGDPGNPGPQTLTNWFKIEKVRSEFLDRTYRLTFCPSVCDSCVTLCNDITRYSSEGHLRLGLTLGDGWTFRFVKASKAIQQVAEKQPL